MAYSPSPVINFQKANIYDFIFISVKPVENKEKLKNKSREKKTYFNERLSNLYMYTLFAALLIFICAVLADAQTLKADYQFQGTLASSVAGAPVLIDLTGSAPNSFTPASVDGAFRQTLRFSFNGGVALFNTNTIISNGSYTLVALFKFDDYAGYKRVADFKNGTSQTGAYLLNGRFESELTSNPPITAGQYVQAVLVREANGHVQAFRDGILRVDIPNDNGLYLISSENILRFAQDDFISGGEASAGNLARLRIYDAPMSAAQAQSLDRLPEAVGDVQGRLHSADGSPIKNAVITVTDTVTGQMRTSFSNPFGYFRFLGLTNGRQYNLSVSHKIYRFSFRTFAFSGPFVPIDIVGSR